MTSVLSVGNTVVRSVPQPRIESATNNNLYQVNFRANDSDQFVRQPRTKGPVYTQPPMLEQQQLEKMIKAQEKKEKKNNFWSKFALFAGIAASLAIVASIFMRGGVKTNKDATKLVTFDVSKEKSFEEMCLPDELKKVIEDLKIKIERSEHLAKKGFKGGGGIMLYGEPGGGKNAFTYALTKYYQKLFPGSELVMVDVNKFKGMYNGETENNIIKFVENIQRKAGENPGKKFIVYLDEFDSIARKATGANAESAASFQNAFKTTLNSLFEIPNVQVIAATNKAAKGQPIEKLLDEAIVNRFAEKIHVPLPTKAAIKSSFLEHFKKLPKELVDPELLNADSKKLDAICEYIVKDSHHASFRDFNYILNQAKIISEGPTRTAGAPISMQDLIDGVIKHSENTNWDSQLLESFKRAMK